MKFLLVVPSFYIGKQTEFILRRLLESISLYEPELLKDVLIIDDYSPDQDATSELLIRLQDRYKIRYIMKPENISYSSIINMGLTIGIALEADVIATVNNDIEFLTPFKDRISTLFKNLPRCSIIGSTLLYPTGAVQSAGYEMIERGNGFVALEYEKGLIYGPSSPLAKQSRFVMGVTGACQFIRRNAIQTLGLYNEDYLLSNEDIEFCLRAWDKGQQVFYDASTQAIHSESVTRGTAIGPKELISFQHMQQDLRALNLEVIRQKIEFSNGPLKRLEEQRRNQGNPVQ